MYKVVKQSKKGKICKTALAVGATRAEARENFNNSHAYAAYSDRTVFVTAKVDNEKEAIKLRKRFGFVEKEKNDGNY